MKLTVLTATSTAFLLASISTALLADSQKVEHTNAVNSLSFKLRNYYQERQPQNWTNDTENKIDSYEKQKILGQGLEMNFESSYFGTSTAGIGFDFSLYGGHKKNYGNKDQYGTTMLEQNQPEFDSTQGKYLQEHGTYGKVGLANVKGFAGNDQSNIHIQAGWIFVVKPLLQTYHRLTPISFQGIGADVRLGDFDLYGVWTNKVSLYDSNKMENFTSLKPGNDGRHGKYTKINHLYTVGTSYKNNIGLGSELAYAESDAYLKLYHVNLNYTVLLDDNISLLLEGRYYKGEENGDKWQSESITYGGFDKDASFYNLNIKLTYDNMISLSASYSQVNAEKNNGLGIFDYHLAYDSNNNYDDLGYWTKRQISDFNYNGEQIWQGGVHYKFDNLGLPGLSMTYTYTQGSNIEATNNSTFKDTYNESEHNIALAYSFQQKELKGLSVTFLYAQHKGDNEIGVLKNQNKAGYEYADMNDIRAYIDYTVSVF